MNLVLMLYEYDPRVRGGMGGFRHAVELAEAWTRAGHGVVIVRPRRGDAADEPTTARVVETPLVDAPVARPLSAYAGLVVAGLRAARRFDPDVIYAREMLGPAPLALGRALGVPVVIEVNGDSYAHRRAALGHGAVRLTIAHALQRLNFRAAARIVTVTPGLRASVIRRFGIAPDRVTVIGNGTNLARLRPMDAAASRRAVGLPEDTPCVGFIGTFFRYQGVDTLLDAAPAILARSPATRFLVVGEGPCRAEWEARARAVAPGAFLFPGQVPHADLARWINAMDVCVAPFAGTRGETSPLKVFDYLACGRPVVVSAIEAVVDDARASGGCLDVPPDDAPALAAAVLRLLDDAALRARLGAAGRAWVERERGWDAVAARVLAVCADAQSARR
jgi:glycosyltransferase involved in cell wall biosynthesis